MVPDRQIEIDTIKSNTAMIGVGFAIFITPAVLLGPYGMNVAVRSFVLVQLAFLIFVYVWGFTKNIKLMMDEKQALRGLDEAATELRMGRAARVLGCIFLMLSDAIGLAMNIGDTDLPFDPRILLTQAAILVLFYAWGRIDRVGYVPSIAGIAAASAMEVERK